MTSEKLNLGAILRADLNQLDEDYEHFRDLDKRHNLTIYQKIVPSDLLKKDLIFFSYYPFNKQMASELIPFENDIPFVNKPSAIYECSEKTFELEHLAHYLPDTLAIPHSTSNEIQEFLRGHKKIIVKPIDGTGGKGVELLNPHLNNEDQERYIQRLNQTNPSGYLMQDFIENQGDSRILCYNGRILGHFGRYGNGKITNNITGGGTFIDIPLTKQDISMSEDIADIMKKNGNYFIGIDVVEGKLLEVNVASPGGISEITPYRGSNIRDVYDSFEEETKRIIKQYK